VYATPLRRAYVAQGGDTDEVRSLREQKATAEEEVEEARRALQAADAAITEADAAFAAGSVPESALDVRTRAHCSYACHALRVPAKSAARLSRATTARVCPWCARTRRTR
jgi:hypothetical protein